MYCNGFRFLVARVARDGLWLLLAPALAIAQSSPFMTGATALQTNILAWLTPIAIILVIAQVLSTYGSGEAQTIVENCGNSLILRCSGSEHGGTSQFASRLIGDREVIRISTSRSRRSSELFGSVTRGEHLSVEPAVMGSEIEQLPDLAGYLKLASRPEWRRVRLHQPVQREPMQVAAEGARILAFPRRSVLTESARTAGSAEPQRPGTADGLEPE